VLFNADLPVIVGNRLLVKHLLGRHRKFLAVDNWQLLELARNVKGEESRGKKLKSFVVASYLRKLVLYQHL
jgi:hypothetical protein